MEQGDSHGARIEHVSRLACSCGLLSLCGRIVWEVNVRRCGCVRIVAQFNDLIGSVLCEELGQVDAKL